MPRRCAQCGAEWKEGALFCENCGAPAEDAPDVFTLQPGTAEEAPAEEIPAAASQDAPEKTRRQRRAERAAAKAARREGDEDYVYPTAEDTPPKHPHRKGKIIGTLLCLLVIALAVGGVYGYYQLRTAVLVPVEIVCDGFARQDVSALPSAFDETLYTALVGQGYFEAHGAWNKTETAWRTVFGEDFSAAVGGGKLTWIHGAQKQNYLDLLRTEYEFTIHTPLLLRVDYTMDLSSDTISAAVERSAYVCYRDGAWTLLQAPF